MRDQETIQTAMTAAETGHLVLSSLHTLGAANSISRIIDVFEPAQQHQIIVQLSMVLQAVISQQLIPDVNGKVIPVFEVMRLTPCLLYTSFFVYFSVVAVFTTFLVCTVVVLFSFLVFVLVFCFVGSFLV